MEAIKKEYPEMQPTESLSHAQGGLTLHCPNCGQLSEQVLPYLFLSDSDVFKNAVFMGPNVAALAQGRCPGCGGSQVKAIFNPAKLKARAATLKSSATEVSGAPMMQPVWSSAYLNYLAVSPNEELAAWVSGGRAGKFEITIAATGTGAVIAKFDHPGHEYPPRSLFVGNDRLLVSTHLTSESKLSHLTLIDTANGKKVEEVDFPDCYFSNPCANPATKTIAAEKDTFNLMILEAGEDKLIPRFIKTGQIFSPGPCFGPDGKIYLNIGFMLYRIEGDAKTEIMRGDHTICCDPAGKIYTGGGHGDRSGESFFHILDTKSGATQDVPWGKDPVDQIALAGKDEVLIGTSISEMNISKYPNALVTCYEIATKKTKWKAEIGDLRAWTKPVLFSAPEEGWALIQTGRYIKQVSLQDGKPMRTIAKQPGEILHSARLGAKRMFGIGRIPSLNANGTLEWYKAEK
jgi:hypothetical protein